MINHIFQSGYDITRLYLTILPINNYLGFWLRFGSYLTLNALPEINVKIGINYKLFSEISVLLISVGLKTCFVQFYT